jgi:hypothetical protein
MLMAWSAIPNTASLSMPGLLAFMERWAPGSTDLLIPATSDQIAALSEPHGGVKALPPVYTDFLATMGASMGDIRLKFGTVAIADLLEDQEDRARRRPDPLRYLKFAIGGDDVNDRHPDDFFDLQRQTADHLDAAIFRIHEEYLLSADTKPNIPYATFSDLLRGVITLRLGLTHGSNPKPLTLDFGGDSRMVGMLYEFLQHLGFAVNELGASRSVVPLEAPERGAVVLISAPTTRVSGTLLQLHAREQKQERILEELVRDYRKELRGF